MTVPQPVPESPRGPGLHERLASGPVVCGEGYLFELERRGYLQAGAFVPEVVLDHPEEVAALHRQFVHAGSDVVEAFTYYAHREKLRVIGKDDILEPLNRQALELARGVADSTGTLLAGNICNTGVYDPADRATHETVRGMFTEQVGWAAEAGVDFVIGETFRYLGEARIALEVIREAGLPAVMLLVAGHEPVTRDGAAMAQACRELAERGADVVGLNCVRGPATMLPLLGPVAAAVDVPVAALPVPYRTHPEQPTFHALRDPASTPLPEGLPFPTALDPFTCHRYEIADFTRRARAAGVRYFGLCCGGAPHHLRAMAETLGRTPPASRYSPDMSKHVYLGADPRLRAANQQFRSVL
ncbi:homocysteine S-methyltransferase family protein [Actinomycetospora cinnamomea]|uniref:Betaine-homocysteine S-methyltransferase n=1 Tax=Actinomycetospora cinnamomea TaxID=663609 RepID=A0A2U1E8T1_9PSEU|nr:homocysteine S-methyltransferase family protein [Actinomycetospora cinnamomea]PVY96348.1 betaine-homocysteine S-methyltransferase [Actinomycetospora cinnamomea]